MKRIPTRSAQSFGLESLESRALMAAADLVSGGLTMLNPFTVASTDVLRPFAFSVANIGNRRAPIGLRVDFYLSRDGVLDAGDLFLRDSILPLPVRPGDSVALNKVIKLPGGMDGGTYQVIMEINPGEHTPESDMSNNTLASAPIQVDIQSHFDSVSLNKLYIRPGSAATLTAHNLTNFDPDAGQVNFYIGTDNGLGGGYPDFGHLTLLGTGTRHGTDYTLSFVADGSLLANSNYFVAEAIKRNGGGGSAWTTVEGRNIGATISSFSFSPVPLTRGQSVSFQATGVSEDATSVLVAYDSNLDNIYQPLVRFPPIPYDQTLATCTQSGSTWTGSFTVPDWFPPAARVFIVAFNHAGVYRAYSTLLIPHV